MDGNRKSFSRLSLEIIATIWLCIEVGQFVQLHSPLGKNELFWFIWVCISLVIILSVRLLDFYIN